MKKKLAIISAAVIVVLAGATAAIAHQRTEWQRDPVGHMIARMSHRLNLTDAQQAQVKSIIDSERPNLQPLMQQLLHARQQMNAAEKNGFDEAQVRSIATAQAQTIADMIVIKERIQSKIYQVLTPEQRTKLDEMRQRRLDRMQQWLAKGAPAS